MQKNYHSFEMSLVLNELQVRQLVNILVATSLQQFYEDGAVVPLNLRLGLFLLGCKRSITTEGNGTMGGKLKREKKED